MAHLTLKNIYKRYSNGFEAVKDISFEGEKGEFIVLVGPSGCGKSTILRMIAGLEDISSGDLYFDDERVNDYLPRQRDVGMVFQNYALYPHLSVYENIAFPLRIKKEKKAVVETRVNEIAGMLDLSNNLKSKPKQLSGGQRQRVALGRAIVRDPKLFLFDEPLSNLDAKLRVQMRTEIQKLHRNINATSVYVTHDQVEAMTMGTKLVVLNKGEIQQIASPSEIYEDPSNIFVAGFIGSPQMNFFKGSIAESDGLYFIEENTNNKIKIDDSSFRDGTRAEKVTVGIRPEYLLIDEKDSTEGFKAKIINVENLGHEVLVYFETYGKIKCSRIDIKSPILKVVNLTGNCL